jgi:glycosyltransferase involved in cell wall biosynthesis
VAPLRLAVFTNQFPGYVSTFFARDMRALIEAGVEVDVFALYPHEPHLWAYVPDILDEHALPRNRVHHLDLTSALVHLRPFALLRSPRFLRDTLAIALSSVKYGPSVLAKSLYAALLAWAWAREFGGRYDHVMAYWGNFPGTCAYLFHRLCGGQIPFSLCVHAQIDLYENPAYLEEKLLYADTIVTICEYNVRFLREQYPDTYQQIADRIHVNYRGLDLGEFPYRAEQRSSRRVLAVGRLSKEKGYDDLLRAVSVLVGRGVDVELELVGEGPERETLTRLADALEIRDKVTFRGWLQIADVRKAMHEATVLAQPSRIEGLPTVIEEAIALGIPVVGSRVGGLPELLDDGRCGVLVEPGDVKGLADGLQTLLGDPALRVMYAERARAHAEKILDMWRNGARLAEELRSAAQRVPGASARQSLTATAGSRVPAADIRAVDYPPLLQGTVPDA